MQPVSSKNVSFFSAGELFPAALSKLKNVNVLLDIGCGIVPQKYIKVNVHICCEPFSQYVGVLQNNVLKTKESESKDTHYVVLNARWDQALSLFPEKSVDSVFLIDVVEHLEKKEALELLRRTEKIVRQQIAVFTPLGFLPQEHPDGKDAWGLDGGAWQEHKSGWQPQDFDQSWDILVAEVFHTQNNVGKKFDTPYGALWAIKDLGAAPNYRNPGAEEKKALLSNNLVIPKHARRYKVHHLIEKLLRKLK